MGVLNENLELVALSIDDMLVLVERNTPLVAAKDVLVLANKVLFSRQDAGMVKQHGRPV